MKTLSVRNPYSYLIVHGVKNVEYRSRPTKYRGTILIHSSGYAMDGLDTAYVDSDKPIDETLDKVDELFERYEQLADSMSDKDWSNKIYSDMKKERQFEKEYKLYLMLVAEESIKEQFKEKVYYYSQAIIGKVDIVDCVKSKEENEYEWILENPYFFLPALKNIKGKLGFWNYDGELPEALTYKDIA